jgi:hypothetical protein
MSTDLTGVVVAVVGIVGTLGATALAQLAAIRHKRLDATIQRGVRAEEREESVRAAAHEEKRAIYADLNAAARDYRTAAHDYLVDKLRQAEPEDLDQLQKARTHYRDVYAHAQMVLPDRALKVASEVNQCLGYSYRALRDIEQGFDRSITVESLHHWYDRPLSDAVGLLRRVLREDLGVAKTSTDIDPVLRRLRQARLDLWPIEMEVGIETSEQANSSGDSLSAGGSPSGSLD